MLLRCRPPTLKLWKAHGWSSPWGLAPGPVEAAVGVLSKNREGTSCALTADSPSLPRGRDLKERKTMMVGPGDPGSKSQLKKTGDYTHPQRWGPPTKR